MELTFCEWIKFLRRQKALDMFNTPAIVELRKLHNLIYLGTVNSSKENLFIEI